MSRGGLLIEDQPKGRTLVVTGSWTAEAEAAVHRPDVEGVSLNYARGFSEPDLSFVGAWPIKRLLVLDRKITDLSPLHKLGPTLEDLYIETAPGAPVDLGALPLLTALDAGWDEVRETFHEPDGLREVVLSDYDEVDLQPLALQPSLEHVTLKVAPHLETLDGLDNAELVTLSVSFARELHDLDSLAGRSRSLRKVKFESCLDIYAVGILGTLSELRFLGISDCGRIPSIQSFANLTLLENFYAWGSTRVEDADLSPLLRLPHLKEIRLRDRREYHPRVHEIVDLLTRR